MVNFSHIPPASLFRPVTLCQYVLLAFWPDLAPSGVSVSSNVEQLKQQLSERILVLDGGMGTMIQSLSLIHI